MSRKSIPDESGYIRLRDISRSDRKRLNRIVRKQKKGVKQYDVSKLRQHEDLHSRCSG